MQLKDTPETAWRVCIKKKVKNKNNNQGKKERESEEERKQNENPGSSVLKGEKKKNKEEKKAVLVWTVWKFVFVFLFLNWHLKQNIEGLYLTFHLHIVWDRQEAKLKQKKRNLLKNKHWKKFVSVTMWKEKNRKIPWSGVAVSVPCLTWSLCIVMQ